MASDNVSPLEVASINAPCGVANASIISKSTENVWVFKHLLSSKWYDMAKDDAAFINALLKNGCAYKVCDELVMFDWNLGSLYLNWIYPVGLSMGACDCVGVRSELDFPLSSYNIALIRPLMMKYKEL